MQNDFTAFSEKEKLFTSDNRILLAISGGIDSVVMLDLFSKTGSECAIVHCNFQLRGEDSAKDEEFVRRLAVRYNMPIFVERFDTLVYSQTKGVSIQQAARDLRYAWFEKIRKTNQYHSIAIAHHKDDAIETFFINLTRGTGISGLGGIRLKNGYVIRPLMFTNREEIILYAEKNNLLYREDSSNKETKYTRNKIRHTIIPLFEELNPYFRQTMSAN